MFLASFLQSTMFNSCIWLYSQSAWTAASSDGLCHSGKLQLCLSPGCQSVALWLNILEAEGRLFLLISTMVLRYFPTHEVCIIQQHKVCIILLALWFWPFLWWTFSEDHLKKCSRRKIWFIVHLKGKHDAMFRGYTVHLVSINSDTF